MPRDQSTISCGHPVTIGWTRLGDGDHPGRMAVLINNGDDGRTWMEVGQPVTVYHDVTGHIGQAVITNQQGWGQFLCRGCSVSVWVPREGNGREG